MLVERQVESRVLNVPCHDDGFEKGISVGSGFEAQTSRLKTAALLAYLGTVAMTRGAKEVGKLKVPNLMNKVARTRLACVQASVIFGCTVAMKLDVAALSISWSIRSVPTRGMVSGR